MSLLLFSGLSVTYDVNFSDHESEQGSRVARTGGIHMPSTSPPFHVNDACLDNTARSIVRVRCRSFVKHVDGLHDFKFSGRLSRDGLDF